MTIIQRELRRGFEISEKVMTGKRPWSDLFVKHTFFTSGYKYYISVISTSKTMEAHKIWSGYVESKVRMLVQKLEQHPSIAMAHAFNKGYERRHKCTTAEEIHQVQEGSLAFLAKPDDPPASEDTTTKAEDGATAPPKAEQAAEVKQENGIPIKKEEEPSSTNGHDDTKMEDDSVVKKDEDADDSEAKVAPKVLDIYTTTHYIGLELGNGKYPSSYLSRLLSRYP